MTFESQTLDRIGGEMDSTADTKSQVHAERETALVNQLFQFLNSCQRRQLRSSGLRAR